MKTRVAFSGRFDPPHNSHFITAMRLSKKYDEVLIVILDYKGRKFSAQYAEQVFNEMIELSKAWDRVKVIINTVHFGELTRQQWDELNCTHYASGNSKVLSHIAELGVKVYYTDRAYDYAAHNYSPSD